MVRDWEKPPDWTGESPLAIEIVRRYDLRELVQRANREYWPWHVLRHKDLPKGIDPALVWGAVKATRLFQLRRIPLRHVGGQNFAYWLPDSAQEDLHYLDRHLGGILGARHPDVLGANRERYLISSLMEEAVASSIIEGAATTREVAREMLRRDRAPRNRAEKMVVNNYRTVQRLKELSGQALTIELLREVHASITEGTLDEPDMCGRFRSAQEPVNVVDYSTGEVLHVPPPADGLPERVRLMCDFAQGRGVGDFIHPIVRAILLHFWLAYDHPFVDGNGRVARALFYWYLLSRDYWLVEFLSLSRAILGARMQYRRAFLWSELDDADATYFVVFHLRQLRRAVDDLYRYLERKERELREGLQRLRGAEGLNHRQRALLQHALAHRDAVYTIRSHRNSHGVAYATARGDLCGLTEKGLLERKKVGREFVFLPSPDIAEKLTVGA